MSEALERTRHARGRRGRTTTPAQTFVFPAAVAPAAVCQVLRPAARRLCGVSRASGSTFDVELTEPEPAVSVVSFTQPDRATPHLAELAAP